MGAHIRHQTAEPLDRQLTPGLTREHHEHDPLQLLGVGLVGFQRQHAFDHDLALLRRDDTRALQRQQQPAALRRQAQQLTVGKNPHAARRDAVTRRRRQRRPLLSEGELGEPVERPLDVGAPEARPFQIARQLLTLGHLRGRFEHVTVEDVDQDVENAASHHSR